MSSINPNDPIYSKYTSGVPLDGTIITNATQTSSLRNREFISSVLEMYLKGKEKVFEVGTGTADQTLLFSERFPTVYWQTSDMPVYHSTIIKTLEAAAQKNIGRPLSFDIDEDAILGEYEVVYSSNVIHCIPWESTQNLFRKTATALKVDGLFILYGPYNIKDEANIDGLYTSPGNKNFDQKLKTQDTRLGLRELGEITELAKKNGLTFEAKHLHEASNNYVLIFKKSHY